MSIDEAKLQQLLQLARELEASAETDSEEGVTDTPPGQINSLYSIPCAAELRRLTTPDTKIFRKLLGI